MAIKLRRVTATRYVMPLKEGGSLPAIVAADDDGMYVLKFRGAGQGPKVLVAELIAGELARAIDLPVPELVFIDLDPDLARTEPDPEIQSLIRASAGLNIGLDYLPGSVMFDPVVNKLDPNLVSKVVWFDAFITNVDRTARNTNLLMWHRKLQLIDHGASLYFHHSWDNYMERSRDPFTAIKSHVLLSEATQIDKADSEVAPRISTALIADIVGQVPDDWLLGDKAFATSREFKSAYTEYLSRRIEAPRPFVEEAIRAHTLLV